MNRTLVGSIVAGILGGLANVAVTLELLERVDSPLFESGRETTLNPAVIGSVADAPHVWLGVFALGFLPLFVTAVTRLLAPTGGFAALLGGVAYIVLTAPVPEQVAENLIEGPFYATNYAKSWYAWLPLLLVAAVAEFALRRGYGLGMSVCGIVQRFHCPGRSFRRSFSASAFLSVSVSGCWTPRHTIRPMYRPCSPSLSRERSPRRSLSAHCCPEDSLHRSPCTPTGHRVSSLPRCFRRTRRRSITRTRNCCFCSFPLACCSSGRSSWRSDPDSAAGTAVGSPGGPRELPRRTLITTPPGERRFCSRETPLRALRNISAHSRVAFSPC
ncbi:hypothetical protein [Natrinema sp. SYSU A 869]|uniref:hypothetical protein n=1 Tax=Natrinema sp. SYSU A 869 TaxID=2871694 RepID=UPI001CA40E2B|nr:hypothetical protein [Natrinema sp. SYSU A 869]